MAIVLEEGAGVESGLYVTVPTSYYAPVRDGRFTTYEVLSPLLQRAEQVGVRRNDCGSGDSGIQRDQRSPILPTQAEQIDIGYLLRTGD